MGIMGIFTLFSQICDKCGYSEKVIYHDDKKKPNEKPSEFIDRFDIKAKSGDIIEYKLLNYSHWAIYTDNGHVIHTQEKENKSFIEEQLLIKVALGFRCRVNNLVEEAHKRGLKARPVSQILKEAHYDLNNNTNLDSIDPQILVTKWKFGQSFKT